MHPQTSVQPVETLDELAWAIAAEGVGAHTAELRAVAASARRAGVSSTLLDVLLDAAAPAVARQRAFGMIAADLARPATAPSNAHVAA